MAIDIDRSSSTTSTRPIILEVSWVARLTRSIWRLVSQRSRRAGVSATKSSVRSLAMIEKAHESSRSSGFMPGTALCRKLELLVALPYIFFMRDVLAPCVTADTESSRSDLSLTPPFDDLPSSDGSDHTSLVRSPETLTKRSCRSCELSAEGLILYL